MSFILLFIGKQFVAYNIFILLIIATQLAVLSGLSLIYKKPDVEGYVMAEQEYSQAKQYTFTYIVLTAFPSASIAWLFLDNPLLKLK